MSTSYRVEISPNSRAGCQDTLCKKNKVKIQKNELRFGTWVEIPSSQYPAAWKWKHWGCVSGKQLENLRNAIATGENEYDFDQIDGYDEMDGDGAEETRQKIRTAMIEGKIADEDFKGDPEFNVLGQSGIRARPPKTPKVKPGEEEQQEQGKNDQPSSVINSPAPKKRGRGKKAADDEDNDDAPPAKKSKITGRKKVGVKAEDDEGAATESAIEQPKKKGRPRKVKDEPQDEPQVEPKVKPEDDHEPAAPAAAPATEKPRRKQRSTKALKTEREVDDEGAPPAVPEKPTRKPRAKKTPKVESDEEPTGVASEAEANEQAAISSGKFQRKSRAKQAHKAKVESEEAHEPIADEANGDAEPAPADEAEAEPEVAPKAGSRKRRGKKSA